MPTSTRFFVLIAAIAAVLLPCLSTLAQEKAASKPLKIFILAGQSNMQGHAMVKTFPHIGMDPKTAPMLKDMTDDKGNPITVQNVWIAELGSGPDESKERHGLLDSTYGVHKGGPKIGPEFTFGIYMHKRLNEPILLIKTAWGGKSLHTDFRPPSGKSSTTKEGNVADAPNRAGDGATGLYYRKMIEHVNKVLADPGRVCPAYDSKAGYVLAGFVWLQGWNDMVDRNAYPKRTEPDGYALYTQLLADLIRDVRKDLNAPKMPFVIGVMGVGGPTSEEIEAKKPPHLRGVALNFRRAMAAPADMPEFKGNVFAVWTDQYWDAELEAAVEKYQQKVAAPAGEQAKKEGLKGAAAKALEDKLAKENMTERELQILVGRSNQAYHYLGSSKILGSMGKAFAEAMGKFYKAD